MKTNRQVHEGRHVDAYTARMSDMLNKTYEEASANGYSESKTRAVLLQRILEVRRELKDSIIELNKANRANLSKGWF